MGIWLCELQNSFTLVLWETFSSTYLFISSVFFGLLYLSSVLSLDGAIPIYSKIDEVSVRVLG